ncbi:uncharacterized protein LOC144429678 [Styela clava]
MDTDHETAIVLLLQNVSLPRTTGSGSRDCSGEIRFPSTASHKCDFAINYCLVFATASTICNINKTREKIPVANHTCDSIIPWNNAGGSPYKIQYYAKNFAGYIKSFTIQYHVINCAEPFTTRYQTTDISTTQQYEQTTQGYTVRSKEQAETTTKNDIIEDTTEGHSTRTAGPTTLIVIAVLVSAVVITIPIIAFYIIRRKRAKVTITGQQQNSFPAEINELVDL